MTPEELAQSIYEQAYGKGGKRVSHWRMYPFVVRAIRDAENAAWNAALEEAKGVVARYSSQPCILTGLNALKHGDEK